MLSVIESFIAYLEFYFLHNQFVGKRTNILFCKIKCPQNMPKCITAGQAAQTLIDLANLLAQYRSKFT